jgi:hypothetical protein
MIMRSGSQADEQIVSRSVHVVAMCVPVQFTCVHVRRFVHRYLPLQQSHLVQVHVYGARAPFAAYACIFSA